MINPYDLAQALGGKYRNGVIRAPGPGHSDRSQSLSIKLIDGGRDFVVHGFSPKDPDWPALKDWVRARSGLPPWSPSSAPAPIRSGGTKVVAEYIYEDENRRQYLRVQRTQDKQFWQAHWTGTTWLSGKPTGPKLPYRLPELLAAEHDAVYICEGEKDADRLAELGLIATTASEGAGKWTADLSPYFQGCRVFILPDNDESGEMHARSVAQHLRDVANEVRIVRLPGLRPKGDVSDWLDAGGNADELARLCEAASPFGTELPPGAISARELMERQFEPIQFVIPDRIVTGAVTLFAGKPKGGKSWLVLDWALAVAGGRPTMNTLPCVVGDVLYCALEDSERRLQERMLRLLGSGEPGRMEVRTKLPRLSSGGLEVLHEWTERVATPRLIVIDVFSLVRDPAKAGTPIYEADYAALTPLKELAAQSGVAIVLVHHLRKAPGESPFDEVSGSIGMTGAVDTTLVLKRGSGRGSATLHMQSRDIGDSEIAMKFDPETCRWCVEGEASEVRRSKERKAIMQILEESVSPLSPVEITALTEMPGGNVRRLLMKMVAAGEIDQVDRGRYTCTNPTPYPSNSGNSSNSGSGGHTENVAPPNTAH